MLLVILVHTGQLTPVDSLCSTITGFGQYGVQLFFVLSAFTLCHSMKCRALTGGEYGAFLVRRFFRIAPMYYLAIPAYYFFSIFCQKYLGEIFFTSPDLYAASDVTFNFLFLHGLFPRGNNSVVPGGWTIGCEFLFYFIFPFLFFWIKRTRLALAWALLGSFLVTFVLVSLRWKSGENASFEMSPFLSHFVTNQFPSFAAGIACFFFFKNRAFRKLMTGLILPSGLLLVLMVGWKWNDCFAPILTGIVFGGLLLLLEKTSQPVWLQRVGQYSFSMYLWHFMVLGICSFFFKTKLDALARPEIPVILLYLGIAAITFGLSSFTYHLIEKPFIDLGRKLSDGVKKPATADRDMPQSAYPSVAD